MKRPALSLRGSSKKATAGTARWPFPIVARKLTAEIGRCGKIKVAPVESYAGENDLAVPLKREGVTIVRAAEIRRDLTAGAEALIQLAIATVAGDDEI